MYILQCLISSYHLDPNMISLDEEHYLLILQEESQSCNRLILQEESQSCNKDIQWKADFTNKRVTMLSCWRETMFISDAVQCCSNPNTYLVHFFYPSSVLGDSIEVKYPEEKHLYGNMTNNSTKSIVLYSNILFFINSS